MEQRGTTTITLSIPKQFRSFFDELTEDGYNRSQLMLKMAKILELLYRRHGSFPGGLPKAIERLHHIAKGDELLYEPAAREPEPQEPERSATKN